MLLRAGSKRSGDERRQGTTVANQQASGPISYRTAGVDIDAATTALDTVRQKIQATFAGTGAARPIGHFGGFYQLTNDSDRYLVASADGIGTKLKLAFVLGGAAHATVGADLVNHCVNDILVQGARPLFFLDYFATGKLEPDVTASVVEGMARACRENGCVLLGGETAEMPSMYTDGEYDLAGFIVGVVDKQRVIDGKSIVPGDLILGLPSTGLQTNGYSLARKLFFEVGGYKVDSHIDELGTTVGEALLATHSSFLPQLGPLLDSGKVKGLAHITGGGFLENIPRILPDNVSVEIDRGSWPEPPIFTMMQRLGNVSDQEMFRTFNMGVGMVIVVSPIDEAAMQEQLNATRIGTILSGSREVIIR